MKISRRSFLGKSLKAMAAAALAPVIVPLIKTKSITATPVPPDKGEVIKAHKYSSKFKCPDFKPHIVVKDYKVGETLTYQDLSTDECGMCAIRAKCTKNGKEFQNSMEIWSRKLTTKFYKEAYLSKLV